MNKFLLTFLCTTLLPTSLLADKKTEANNTLHTYDIEEVYVYDQPKELTGLVSNHLNSTTFSRLQLNSRPLKTIFSA